MSVSGHIGSLWGSKEYCKWSDSSKMIAEVSDCQELFVVHWGQDNFQPVLTFILTGL